MKNKYWHSPFRRKQNINRMAKNYTSNNVSGTEYRIEIGKVTGTSF